jgi:quinol monooxygenase YgiN
MAVILLSRIRIKSGAEAQFETVIRDLYGEMRRHEPGCRLNIMHRSLGGPPNGDDGDFASAEGAGGTYVFYEVYESEADGRAHTETAHFAAFIARSRDLIEGKIELEFLDEITRK